MNEKVKNTIFVIPSHKHVRDPETMKPLPMEGAEVPRNQFWLRRLHFKEVTLDDGKKAKSKKVGVAKSVTQKEGE